MKQLNEDLLQLSAYVTEARWNFETNITDETSKAFLEAAKAYDAYERGVQNSVITFRVEYIEDAVVRRQIEQMKRYAINTTIWTEEASARERYAILHLFY